MKVIPTRLFITLLAILLMFGLTPATKAFADVGEPYEGGLLSVKGEKWEIGGELEVEYRDAQRDASDSQSQFKIDQFYLIPKIKLKENVNMKAEIQVTDGGTVLEEGHVTFSGFPGKTFIKVGLDDRFIKRSRITETYPLNGSAFWRDDDLGITVGGKLDYVYWFLSYTNGLRIASGPGSLRSQKVMEDGGAKFLHEDRNVGDTTENKEIGFGAGHKHDLGEFGKIDVLAWFFANKLTPDEVTALNAVLASGGYSSLEDSKSMFGIRVTHNWQQVNFVGEYISSSTGDMDRKGWYIEPSYKFRTPWNRPKSIVVLIRYNDLDNGLINDPGEVLTWDWQVFTLAGIVEIQKNVKVKLEYSFIDEDTGGAVDVENNEFLAQLEVTF